MWLEDIRHLSHPDPAGPIVALAGAKTDQVASVEVDAQGNVLRVATSGATGTTVLEKRSPALDLLWTAEVQFRGSLGVTSTGDAIVVNLEDDDVTIHAFRP